MKYQELYSELGKLLYAIADIDGVITPHEKQKVLDLVRTELLPGEKHTDQFGTNAAHYAAIEFEILEDDPYDSATALESFIAYMEAHRTAIDERTKEVCIAVVEELAAAYYHTNKQEKQLVEKLIKKLDAIKFNQPKQV